MNVIKDLLSKALDLVQDDAKLVVCICLLGVVTVLYLIEKGLITL